MKFTVPVVSLIAFANVPPEIFTVPLLINALCKCPAFANPIVPLFVKLVVPDMLASTVNSFPLATVIVPCSTSASCVTSPVKFVVPVPLISLANVPVPRFNIPALSIALVITKSPAAIFTVPDSISISFCVTVLLKYTFPAPVTVVVPAAVVALSVIVPLNVIFLPAAAVNVISPAL